MLFHESRTLWLFSTPWERKGGNTKNRRPITVSRRPFARHGAARGRPERLSAHRPHQQHGLLGFHESRVTRHATWFSPSLRRLQGEQPQARPTGFSRNTKHETRNTSFPALRFAVGAPCGEKAELKVAEPKTEIRRPDCRARRPLTTSMRISTRPFLNILSYCRLITIFSESLRFFCPLLPGILRNSSEFFGYPPPEPVSARRPPFSLGFPARAVSRSSRRPPGSFRCGQRKMNPC